MILSVVLGLSPHLSKLIALSISCFLTPLLVLPKPRQSCPGHRILNINPLGVGFPASLGPHIFWWLGLCCKEESFPETSPQWFLALSSGPTQNGFPLVSYLRQGSSLAHFLPFPGQAPPVLSAVRHVAWFQAPFPVPYVPVACFWLSVPGAHPTVKQCSGMN